MATRTLVVGDGGLASGIACAVAVDERLTEGTPASRGAAGVLWRPTSLISPDQLAARTSAIELQAGSYGFEAITDGRHTGKELSAEVDGTGGLGFAAAGLLAVAIATRARCTKIVWALESVPHPEGPNALDLDEASRTLDRCVLLERLAMLETRNEVAITAPYADLSDTQLAEIALDLSVPISSCWWWTGDDRAKARWTAALKSSGWTESMVEPVSDRPSVRVGS